MSFFQNHSGWPLVPLKNIATLKRGYDLPVGARNEGAVPIYAANGKNGAHDEVKIKGPGVITGRSGTIGKVHYCEEGFWPLNTALYVMDFHGNHPRWVYYMLSAFKLERFSEGAGVPTLNRNLVHDELIPLPPLPEQKRIAAILDKADGIRRKRQQAIQLADDFLRAVFLDMFGDPVTNPKGWEVKTLASITKDWRGGASIKPDDFTDSGFPVLHKGAIHQHGKIVLDESKKTFVSNEFAEAKKGSLVGRDCVAITLRDLVPSGPSIGLMADLSDYATGTYLLSQGAYGFCVKPEELHAAYLVALSNHDGFRQEFKKISVGSTQIHIRSSDLKELALPVPPVELQRKYGAIRRTVINFQKKAASGEEQGELFDSLSQKAFRGEL